MKTTADQRGPEPTRDEVFAFVDAHPESVTVAADCVKHFAGLGRVIDGGKVRMWLSRRRHADATPATVATSTPVAGDKGGLSVGGKWAVLEDPPPAGQGRAREPSKTDSKPVQRLAPAMKQWIRDAAEGFASFLATAKDCAIEVEVIKANPKGDGGQIRVLDMQQYLNAAKSLAQVMDLAKGTDAFDNDTGGEVEETNDEAAQLADAFGFKR